MVEEVASVILSQAWHRIEWLRNVETTRRKRGIYNEQFIRENIPIADLGRFTND